MDVDDEVLLDYATKGQWKEVVEAYKKNPTALGASITKSHDSVMHIAIYVGQTHFVTSLLDRIKEDEDMGISNILSMKNSEGNIPLHLAAELGNVEICRSIAETDPNLIFCRNMEGETPLFLAAHYGNKDAFFCLHGYLNNKGDCSPCRKSNGDTILHSAIYGEFFDLAFQILHLYPHLASSRNEEVCRLSISWPSSLTALEAAQEWNILNISSIIVSKQLNKYLYIPLNFSCLIVDELNEEIEVTSRRDRKRIECPENKKTCMDMLGTLKIITKVLTKGKDGGKAATDDEENPPDGDHHLRNEHARRKQEKSHRSPPMWETPIRFLAIMMNVFLVIFGVGAPWIRKIQRKKEKHVWAKQVMVELVRHSSFFKYEHTAGRNPDEDYDRKKAREKKMSEEKRRKIKETPFLTAAKLGVTEMVEKILDTFPSAIQDLDAENKNAVLLAIENRQPHVFNLLKKRDFVKEIAFRQVDSQGHSALHLAAAYNHDHKPWRLPGSAIQMQWEYKWYKLVKESMPPNFFSQYNFHGETAKHLFVTSHGLLVKEGSKWLTKTAESCSLVAALVATVAFTTATAIPGGSNQDTGVPLLQGRPLFKVFTVASLVALCSSVMSLVMLLSILTSRFQEKDFAAGLPRKLLVGMSSLFTSISAVLISFCAGHLLIVEAGLRVAVYPVYAATFSPVTVFALAQLPLNLDLVLAICRKVPQRSYKVFTDEMRPSISHRERERKKIAS